MWNLNDSNKAHLNALDVAHVAFIRGIPANREIMKIVSTKELARGCTQLLDLTLIYSPRTFPLQIKVFREWEVAPKWMF